MTKIEMFIKVIECIEQVVGTAKDVMSAVKEAKEKKGEKTDTENQAEEGKECECI